MATNISSDDEIERFWISTFFAEANLFILFCLLTPDGNHYVSVVRETSFIVYQNNDTVNTVCYLPRETNLIFYIVHYNHM